jgi:chromosome segregation ATPase
VEVLVAKHKSTAEFLKQTRALLSTQLSTEDATERNEKLATLAASAAARFQSVHEVVSSLQPTEVAVNKQADDIASLQQRIVGVQLELDTQRAAHDTLTKENTVVTDEARTTTATLLALQHTHVETAAALTTSKQSMVEESTKLQSAQQRLDDMAERFKETKAELDQVQTQKEQTTADCAAARQQLDEMAIDLQKLNTASSDADRANTRANKLEAESRTLKQCVQEKDALLKAANQEKAKERTRRIDAEALLEDQGSHRRSSNSSKFDGLMSEISGRSAGVGRPVKAARTSSNASGALSSRDHKPKGSGSSTQLPAFPGFN